MEDINRRDFIKKSTMATAALTLPTWTITGVETKMGIVVHSYAFRWNSKTPSAKYPGFVTAKELLQHTYDIGGAGIQVMVDEWESNFAKEVRDLNDKLGLYIEGSIRMPQTKDEVSTFSKTVTYAKAVGVNVFRTVTSSGRRYEVYHSAAEVDAFKKKALQQIEWVEPILAKHKVKLGVENHKDWTAPELADAMKKISSEYVGVTLDFGNSIALSERPMSVIETLVPYVVSTHVKDMAVEEYSDGFLLSEVPLGKGFIEVDKIFSMVKKANPKANFSLEMITRDPLQIPVKTKEYWESVPKHLATMDLDTVLTYQKQQKMEPPRVSQLDAEGKLAVEEQNIIECIDYSKSHLK